MKKKKEERDDIIINVLIVSLILGIVISLGFYYYVKEDPDSFTEVYFNDHQNLPYEVNLNEDYSFSLMVSSHENQQEYYDYNTQLELYNIYDTSPGYFDCSKETREKIYLDWIPANYTNYTIFDVIGYDEELFEDFYTLQNMQYSPQKVFGEYDLQFILSGRLGNGSFSINFVNDTNSKYKIVLSEKNQTGYLYFNDILKETEYINISTKRENPIYLRIRNNRLNLTINGRQIFYKTINDYDDGRFIFESKNGYYKIIRTLLITDKEKIEYVTSDNVLNNYMNEIYSRKTDKIDFVLKGEIEPIRYNLTLNYFLNLTANRVLDPEFGEVDFEALAYQEESGIYPILFDWAGFQYPLTDFPSYAYEADDVNLSEEKIDFGPFNLSFIYDARFGERQIALYFYDYYNNTEYMFLASHKNSLFMFTKFFNNTLEITKKRRSVPEKTVEAKLSFDEGNLKIFIDDEEIMHINDVKSNFSGFSIESKNSYSLINKLAIERNHPLCGKKTFYELCYKTYELQGERDISSRYENIGLIESIGEEDENYTIGLNESSVEGFRFSFEDLFTKEQIEEFEQKSNPFIEDKFVSLDGPASLVSNLDDYEFEFGFRNVDGLGIVYLGFKDLNNTDILRIITFEDTNNIIVQTRNRNFTFNHIIEKNKDHFIKIVFRNGKMHIRFDDHSHDLISFGVDLSNGYFYAGTQNTYTNFRTFKLEDNSIGTVKRFNIGENPCRLRLIDRIIFDDMDFSLNPGEDRMFTYDFNIKNDFDYGKITSTLTNKNHTIYFWIKR